MKKIIILACILSLALLTACGNHPDQEISYPVSQTDTENVVSKPDPIENLIQKPPVSDSDGIEASSQAEEASTSSPERSSEESESSQTDAADQPHQSDGGVSVPTQPKPVPTEKPDEPETSPPPAEPQTTLTEPTTPPAEPSAPENEPETPPAPTEPPAPEAEKTIYDYPFDASAIRSELISIGESMGLTHVTSDAGVPCTPDSCSWASPITASSSMQGDNLKRALHDYVSSMPGIVTSYGGAALDHFTIYVRDNGGSYTFYFLY